MRGLHFLLTALALPVSEATHTNSPACPTPSFSMTHAMHPREGARDTLAAVMSYEQSVESVDAAAAERRTSSQSTGKRSRRPRGQPAEAQEAPFRVAAVLYGSRMLLIAA